MRQVTALHAPDAETVSHPSIRHPRPERSALWGIVLAGGDGVRLRELAGMLAYPGCPKQYAVAYDGRCLLRHTLERAELLIPPERIVTIVSQAHHREAQTHLADRPPGTVLAQPANRGTAAGVLLGLAWILKRTPGATVVILPSDHFVGERERFMAHVQLARCAVERAPRTMALLGAPADSPDAEYGWIEPGTPALLVDGRPIRRVRGFREKPLPLFARALHARGALWNTMVVVVRAVSLLELFAQYAPGVLRPFLLAGGAVGEPGQEAALRDVYRQIPSVSFSDEVLARNPAGARVLELEGVLWSDWGTAGRICRTLGRLGRIQELRDCLRRRGCDPDAVLPEMAAPA